MARRTTTAKKRKTATGAAESRDELLRVVTEYQSLSDEIIRRAVIDESRFDILASEVLGLEVEEAHLELLAFALQHKNSLHLAFRGCGKTTTLTVVYAIGRILQDPELRILIGSQSLGYAKTILKEIKGHLESERLTEVFGDQRSPTKWEETEATVLGKTKVTKESSFTALGCEGQLTGRHFDIILVDDLVSETNCRTRAQREKVKTFFYKTLDPCLEPGGEKKVIGTRYHPLDLYGHLCDHEYSSSAQIIPALFEYEEVDPSTGKMVTRYESSAPGRFPVSYLLEKRDTIPTIVWLTQYQCETSRYHGRVFRPEFFEREGFYFSGPLPEGSFKYQAVDPAVTEDTANDFFALMTIAVDGDGDVWVDSYDNVRLEFPDQPDHCIDRFDEEDPIRLGIESNAYQKALGQEILRRAPHLKGRVVPLFTDRDKMTRALKLTAYFQTGRIHLRREHSDLVEQLLEFPEGEHDDLFDALDLAVQLGTRTRVKRKRRKEFGVL